MQIVIDIDEDLYIYMQSRYKYQNKGDEGLSTAEEVAEAHNMAIEALEAQPKTGHWEKHKHNGKLYFKCSECLYFALIRYSYCPNCGAKMQEVQK